MSSFKHPGISVGVCYADKDAEGNALDGIVGAVVEVLEPGRCDWEIAGEVAYPELVFKYFPPRDGQYAFRSRTKSAGVTQGCEPHKSHCYLYGAYSAPTVAIINNSPPAAPAVGPIFVPCPDQGCCK